MEILVTTFIAAVGGLSALAFRYPASFDRLFKPAFIGSVTGIWVGVVFIGGVAVGRLSDNAKAIPGMLQPFIWWLAFMLAALLLLDCIKPKQD